MIARHIHEVVDDLVDIIGLQQSTMAGIHVSRLSSTISNMVDLDVSHMVMDDDDFWLFKDCTPGVMWPIKVGFAGKTGAGVWNFVNARSVTPKEVRGRVNITSKNMLLFDTVALHPNGRVIGIPEVFAYINNKWVSAERTGPVRSNDYVGMAMPPDVKHSSLKASAMLSLALRQRYEWSVSVREPSSASFRFSTDAQGVRAMVSERDKGVNGRRSALRNWVVDHWRQSRSDTDSEIYVRKHLRGGEAFTWRGYECRWSPAMFDVEANIELAAYRSSMGEAARRPLEGQP